MNRSWTRALVVWLAVLCLGAVSSLILTPAATWGQARKPSPQPGMKGWAKPPATGIKQTVLIVLQENSGRVDLPPDVPPAEQQTIYGVLDQLAESFENVKSTLQGAGRYDRVILLTDESCKRANLLANLVDCSRHGDTIDLLVLGHGSNEQLALNGETLHGEQGGNLRSLVADARSQGVSQLNLRMVYMCNCYGSTLSDDWLAIGAKVSVGSVRNDYMPEPMITLFIQSWVANQNANDAARNAYEGSKPAYAAAYPPVPQTEARDVAYPCTDGSGTWVEDPPPCPRCPRPRHWVPNTCHKTEYIPNGRFDTNPKILDSELVVNGDGGMNFDNRPY